MMLTGKMTSVIILIPPLSHPHVLFTLVEERKKEIGEGRRDGIQFDSSLPNLTSEGEEQSDGHQFEGVAMFCSGNKLD